MRSFLYFVKQAFINSKRNFSTGFGAVITIFLAMFIIGVFMFANDIIGEVANSVEDQVSITCYVADDAQQTSIDSLMSELKGNSLVSTVSFTDKEQALEDFKGSLTTNADIIDALDGQNPLPASINIEMKDPEDVETVVNEVLQNQTFISICDNPSDPSDSVKYGQQTVEKLFTVTNLIRYAGIAVVVLLVFVTLVFINNTIRLAILARRREISIERLVGASNGFIRGPFLVEGALQAALGAGLAVAVLAVFRNVALPQLQNSITWLPITISDSLFMWTSVFLVAMAIFIGLIGSAFAMRRYLKV